jgi:hypothetical protein
MKSYLVVFAANSSPNGNPSSKTGNKGQPGRRPIKDERWPTQPSCLPVTLEVLARRQDRHVDQFGDAGSAAGPLAGQGGGADWTADL